jgi:hypothetical protein
MSTATAALLVALASSSVSATEAGPTRVFIGTHVVEMRNVDVRSQSFYADFYLWLRFAAADEQTYVCFRITGTFFYLPDLRLYPFDTQRLPIAFENASLSSDEMVFVDDRATYERSGEPETRWGINRALHVPEYVLSNVERTVADAPYPTNFGDPARLTEADQSSHYSRFAIEVTFAREYLSYAFKILIPLLIILAMAFVVFFVPTARVDVAAPIAMTSLLSCMAYNVAVTQNLPDVGYLVLSDKFFIATYLLLLVTLVSTFVTFLLDGNGRGSVALQIQRRARWAFPAAVALIFTFFVASAI